MQIFSQKSECCGCAACMNICPKNAIKMTADDEGFLYPEVDNGLCVDCGLCKKVCAFQNGYKPNSVLNAYGLKHNDYGVRFSSRSGGAFILVSDRILKNGGAVYGAAFRDNFTVCHKRAVTKDERDKFKGSKYVQSETGSILRQVKNDLQSGKSVMFSGTACQVAGLITYLEKSKTDMSALYTVDLVCHGVPSNKIWSEFLSLTLKKSGGSKITGADFRDKTLGWSTHYESVWVDGKKITTKDFAALFYKNDILRPSCYECKYTNTNRPADFTLADFWGADRQLENFDDDKGVSLFLVNTEKGQRLFDEVRANCDCREVKIEDCTRANPNLRRTTEKPADREDFWNSYYKNGFEKTFKAYKRKIFVGKVKKKLFK